MPTLIRFFVVLLFLAGLVFAGMFALVSLVEPREKEEVRNVPASRFLDDN